MRTKQISTSLILLASLFGGACVDDPEVDLATDEQSLEGRLGAFEFAIDAPWRLEPTLSLTIPPTKSYGAVPIHVAILDAHINGELQSASFNKLLRVEVFEETSPGSGVQTFLLPQLHEVQYTTGKWKFPQPPTDPDGT